MASTNYTPTTTNSTNYVKSSSVSSNYVSDTKPSSNYVVSSSQSSNYQIITLLLANDDTVLANSEVYNALGEDTTDPSIYQTVNYVEG